jgi:ribosome-associated protein
MRLLVVNSRLRIPMDEFRVRYARSSGPGGQNVNKVNSKVTVRWMVPTSPSLPDGIRQAVLKRCRRRLTGKGELLITSQRFRDAPRNLADCLEKLRKIVAEATLPRKTRKPARPTKASIARRLDQKRIQARKKESRRAEPWS